MWPYLPSASRIHGPRFGICDFAWYSSGSYGEVYVIALPIDSIGAWYTLGSVAEKGSIYCCNSFDRWSLCFFFREFFSTFFLKWEVLIAHSFFWCSSESMPSL